MGRPERLALIAAFAAFAVVGCGREFVPTRSDIEAFVGVALPAGAQDFAAAGERGIDTLVRARFALPEASADDFAVALIGHPLEPGHDPGIASSDPSPPGWPRMTPPGHAGAARNDWPRGRTHRLMSVPFGSGWRMVYLVSFTL